MELIAYKAKKHIKDKKTVRISDDLFKGELECLSKLNHPNIVK
jgi:hypothetical protein